MADFNSLWSFITETYVDIAWKSHVQRVHFGVVYALDTKNNTMSVYLDGKENSPKTDIPINVQAAFGFGIRTMPIRTQIVVLLSTYKGYVHVGSILPNYQTAVEDVSDTYEDLKEKQPSLTKLKEGEIFMNAVGRNFIHLKSNGETHIQVAKLANIKLYRDDRRVYAEAKQHTRQTPKEKSYEWFGRVMKHSFDDDGNKKIGIHYPESDEGSPDYDEYRLVQERHLPEKASEEESADPFYEKHMAPTITSDEKDKGTEARFTTEYALEDDSEAHGAKGCYSGSPSEDENIVFYEKFNLSDDGEDQYPTIKTIIGENGTIEITIIANDTQEGSGDVSDKEEGTGTTIIVNQGDKAPLANEGVIDVGYNPQRLATENFVINQFNVLVEWILSHKHVGNLGGLTPVNPINYKVLNDLYNGTDDEDGWLDLQEPDKDNVLTRKLRSD